MSGLRIVVTPTGGTEIKSRLDRAAALAKNPTIAAKAAAEWMAGETFRIFSAAMNVDGPWASLSKMTMFLRMHRANAPRSSNTPGSDTGRLKGSFMPEWADDGKSFGAGTNVEYAQDFNDGGPSKANVVAIAGFKRKGMKKKMKDYLMHMQAGHDVPARQFFPNDMEELQAWGYVDKVREIFEIDFKNALGGTA